MTPSPHKGGIDNVPAGRVKVRWRSELTAFIVVVAALLVVPVWLLTREAGVEKREFPAGAKIFNLTGLGSQGRWTLEEVTGFNYWWKTFPKAEIRLNVGEVVGIRLQSADVSHIFYCPSLRIGPVYIEPGHVERVLFTAAAPGTHYYYCMSICGDCHYFMRGEIIIGNDAKVEVLPEDTMMVCPDHVREPGIDDVYDRGSYLFQKMGCIACHGDKGGGDVRNPNYVNRSVPHLNTLADRMFLYTPKTAGRLAQVIADGRTADEMEESSLGIPQQARVVAQYRTVRNVIKNGRTPARFDTTSFVPPLAMPSWGARLSDKDIDAILVFLLRNQIWVERDD